MKFMHVAAVLAFAGAAALNAQTWQSNSTSQCNNFTGQCSSTTTTTEQPNPWAEIQRRNEAMAEAQRREQDKLNNWNTQPAGGSPGSTPMCTKSELVNGMLVFVKVPCSSF